MFRPKHNRRVIITFQGEQIHSYKHTNPRIGVSEVCSYSCERVSTQINCPKCSANGLVEYLPNYPGIDLQCIKCGHQVEVKSIIQQGTQKNGFEVNRAIKLKLGSTKTYKVIRKENRTLIIYWYKLKQDDECLNISIQTTIAVNMGTLIDGVNCKSEIVLQKKKKKPKVALTIFSEFLTTVKVFNKSNFNNPNAELTSRGAIVRDSMIFIRFINKAQNYAKKRKRYIMKSIYKKNKKQKIISN